MKKKQILALLIFIILRCLAALPGAEDSCLLVELSDAQEGNLVHFCSSEGYIKGKVVTTYPSIGKALIEVASNEIALLAKQTEKIYVITPGIAEAIENAGKFVRNGDLSLSKERFNEAISYYKQAENIKVYPGYHAATHRKLLKAAQLAKERVENKRRQSERVFMEWCIARGIPIDHIEAQGLWATSKEKRALYPEKYCKACDGAGVVVCKKCAGRGKKPVIDCRKCERGKVECAICGGSGKIVCDKCKGEGKYVGDCPYCSGIGLTGCPRCSGLGKIPCPICKGKGEITEYRDTVFFDDDGNTHHTYQRVRSPCPNCSGTGYIPCSICNEAGQIRCPKCAGKGRMLIKCEKCKGSGGIICSDCRGTGKITCPHCHGHYGHLEDCLSCKGRGLIECPNCTGIKP